MLPSFSRHHPGNSTLSYVEMLCNRRLCPSLRFKRFRFHHIGLSQFMVWTTLTFSAFCWAFTGASTPGIFGISYGITEIKMVRVHTLRCVAFMTNPSAFWNWTVDQHPCHAVRIHFLMVDKQKTISKVSQFRVPEPAVSCRTAVNLAPESRFKSCARESSNFV